MVNYADFDYYTNTYKGAVLDTASFDTYARKATQNIILHTFGRIPENNVPEAAKMCCCELAEEMYKHDKGDVGNIASEKVGERSVSFVDKEKAEAIFWGKCTSIIYNWLATTGLLYRGC